MDRPRLLGLAVAAAMSSALPSSAVARCLLSSRTVARPPLRPASFVAGPRWRAPAAAASATAVCCFHRRPTTPGVGAFRRGTFGERISPAAGHGRRRHSARPRAGGPTAALRYDELRPGDRLAFDGAFEEEIFEEEVPVDEYYDAAEAAEDVKHESSASSASAAVPDDDGEGSDDGETEAPDGESLRSRLRSDLRAFRLAQSSSAKKPPYTVFTNAALDGICASLPRTDEELLRVKGIGPKKLERYGEAILEIVAASAAGGGLSPLEGGPQGEGGASGSKPIPEPERIEAESLTSEQRSAADAALEGGNVFVSGAAGTGKSHVCKYIVQEFRGKGRTCAPTAPTGVAAVNVGGSTLHSFFGEFFDSAYEKVRSLMDTNYDDCGQLWRHLTRLLKILSC